MVAMFATGAGVGHLRRGVICERDHIPALTAYAVALAAREAGYEAGRRDVVLIVDCKCNMEGKD